MEKNNPNEDPVETDSEDINTDRQLVLEIDESHDDEHDHDHDVQPMPKNFKEVIAHLRKELDVGQEQDEVPEQGKKTWKKWALQKIQQIKRYKDQKEKLSAEFFDYGDDALEAFDPDVDKTKNYQKMATEYIMKFLQIIVAILIVRTFLNNLGKEESQSLKYSSSLTLTYKITDVPRLFAVHQFIFFDKTELKNRIKCKLFNDQDECRNIEEIRCNYKGKSTQDYEECMVDLYRMSFLNSTQFCEEHYQDTTIWKDNVSPEKLQYYLRLHNCYLYTGVQKGRQYCNDYFHHEDSWGKDNLYDCYKKYNVEFAKEYCDYKFPDGGFLLMQCYGTQGVSKNEEFCLQTFQASDLLIGCYESIPLYNQNYCRLLHPSGGKDLIDCFVTKVGLTLDSSYCDDQYPLEPNLIEAVVNRYACYKELGLSKQKDRDYCELTNMEDVMAKYDCIKTVNYEIAQNICQKEKNEKLRRDCIREKTPEVALGAEYCYYLYPWDDQFDQLKQCLIEEQIPQEYLSSHCIRVDAYNRKYNENYDKQEMYDCLGQYGIPNENNQCAEFQMMPKGQNYVIQKMRQEQVVGYQMSKNLKNGEQNFKYKSLDYDLRLLDHDRFFFLGGHNSIYEPSQTEFDAFHLWILEENYQDYLNNGGDFQLSEYLLNSYGHFILREEVFESIQSLQDEAKEIEIKKQIYQNPMLEKEETVFKVYEPRQPIKSIASVVDEMTTESIVSAMDLISRMDLLGQLIEDLNNFIAYKQLPKNDSLSKKLFEEIKDQNLTIKELLDSKTPIMSQVSQEIKTVNESLLLVETRKKNITWEICTSLVDESRMKFPFMDTFIINYQESSEQSMMGTILDEIYQMLKESEPLSEEQKESTRRRLQANGRVLGGDFFQKLETFPTFGQMINDLSSISVSQISNGYLPPVVSSLVEDLSIDSIIQQATLNQQIDQDLLNQKLEREKNYLTAESSQQMKDEIESKNISGQLIQEYYTLQPEQKKLGDHDETKCKDWNCCDYYYPYKTQHCTNNFRVIWTQNQCEPNKYFYFCYPRPTSIFQTLLSDLSYISSSDQSLYEKLDNFIQQSTVQKILSEIRELSSINNLLISENILSHFSGPIAQSIMKLKELPVTAGFINFIENNEPMTAGEMMEVLKNRKYLKNLYNEYQEAIFQGKRRMLLEKQQWQVGQWYFEHQNSLVLSAGSTKYHVSLVNDMKINVRKNDENTTISMNDRYRNTFNQRKLSVKNSIYEMIGQRISDLPNLQCHFSGDYQEAPWWKLDFDQEYQVVSVKIFNIENGALSSNIESSIIYVGETLCARIGPQLPFNEYITFYCEQAPKNAFGGEKQTLMGTIGKYLKIQSKYPGVLAICDIELEIRVIDIEMEKQLDQNLSQCQNFQANCRSLFPSLLESENKINCLERFGFNRSADFCTTQLKVTSGKFSYPLKHKYECLSNPVYQCQIDYEAGICLNKYYDYQVEVCLREYESKFEKMGFVGGEKPDEKDPFSFQSSYWQKYSNLTMSIRDKTMIQENEEKEIAAKLAEELLAQGIEKRQQEEILQEIQEDIPLKINYEINDQMINQFVCQNSEMIFYTNPYDNEIVFQTNCEVFQIEEMVGIHFYIPKQSSTEELVINRTDINRQYFKITFNKDLEFLTAKQSEMYFREQDPQNEETDIPIISSSVDYKNFTSSEFSVKLYSSEPIIVGQTYSQETNLVSVPQYNKSLGVAKKDALKIWRYPIFFTNTFDHKIIFTPERNLRLALPLSEPPFSSFIHLKLNFFKKEFDYSFYNLSHLFTELGGVCQCAEGYFESIIQVMLLLFMVNFVQVIQKKHKNDHKEFVNEKYWPKMKGYQEVIKSQIINNSADQDLQKDLETINKMIIPEEILEGGQQELTKVAQICFFEEKYGKQAKKLNPNSEILNIEQVEFKTLHDRLNLNFFEVCKKIKKNVSFFGIYKVSDKIMVTDHVMFELEKRLKFIIQKFLQHQNMMLIQQKIIQRKMEEEKVGAGNTLKVSQEQNEKINEIKGQIEELKSQAIKRLPNCDSFYKIKVENQPMAPMPSRPRKVIEDLESIQFEFERVKKAVNFEPQKAENPLMTLNKAYERVQQKSLQSQKLHDFTYHFETVQDVANKILIDIQDLNSNQNQIGYQNLKKQVLLDIQTQLGEKVYKDALRKMRITKSLPLPSEVQQQFLTIRHQFDQIAGLLYIIREKEFDQPQDQDSDTQIQEIKLWNKTNKLVSVIQEQFQK